MGTLPGLWGTNSISICRPEFIRTMRRRGRTRPRKNWAGVCTFSCGKESVAKDLSILQPLITPENLDRLSLCTDDLSARDLYERGHLDLLVSSLVRSGIPLARALRLVTTNPALYFNLVDRNRPAPGRKADLVVFDRPDEMRVRATVKDGKVVFREGEVIDAPRNEDLPVRASLRVAPFSKEELRRRGKGKRIRVIGVKEGAILTEDISADAKYKDGYLAADGERDIAFAYIFDRYRSDKKYGFGFVTGFGLRQGALGTTYAHDSHNLIVMGADVDDIHRVFELLRECGGGMAASHKGATALIPMPYFGILSQLDGRTFLDRENELYKLLRRMGVTLKNPFFQMSFLSLPVLPSLRLTTGGLFHVPTSAYVETNYD